MADLEQKVNRLESDVADLKEEIRSLKDSFSDLRHSGKPTSEVRAETRELEKSIDNLMHEVQLLNKEKENNKASSPPAPMGTFIVSTLLVFLLLSIFVAIFEFIGIVEDDGNLYRFTFVLAALFSTGVTIYEVFHMSTSPEYGSRKSPIYSLYGAIMASMGLSSWLVHELVTELWPSFESLTRYIYPGAAMTAALLLFIAWRTATAMGENQNYPAEAYSNKSTG